MNTEEKARRAQSRRWIEAILAFAWLAAAGVPAVAQAAVGSDGPVIGGSYILEPGATVVGELTTIGADVTLEEGSTVAGRVNVVGGSLVVRGRVNGVIHVYFGTLSLGDTAHVNGSVYTEFARVDRAPGAVVTNAYEVGEMPAIRFELPAGIDATVAAAARATSPASTWGMLVRAIGLALATALATALMPGRLVRIAREAVEQPLRAAAYGLTLGITAVVAIVLFVVTIVGIPVALAIGALVWVGALVGVAAIAHRVGTWLERPAMDASPSLMYAAMGGFVVGLLMGAVGWVPVLGGIAEALVGVVALGAVASSRLGSTSSGPDARPVAPAKVTG